MGSTKISRGRAASRRAGGPALARTDTERRRRGLRSPWLWTWLQPVAVLVVILAGGMATDQPYPAGEPKETVLLVWLIVVTLPGLVAQVIDAVRASHRTAPGERSEYQRLLQQVQPQPAAPVLRPSPAADAGARIFQWFLLVSALDLALAVALSPVPVDEDWRTLAFLPVMLAMCLMLVVILAAILVLAVVVIRLAFTADPGHPFIPAASLEAEERVPVIFRALMLSLGVSLLGLLTFGIPYAVLTWGNDVDLAHHGIWGLFALGTYAATVDSGDLAWIWALRITVVMALGGLAGCAVLSPFAFRRMIMLPARRSPDPGATPGE